MSFFRHLLKSVRLSTCVAVLTMVPLNTAVSQVSSPDLQTHTVSGNVSILDRDGKSISDRSNVVLFIDGLSSAEQSLQERSPHLMSHANRVFSPAVLPIRRGEVLDFFNDDDIFHNVFSLSSANKFDLGIYPAGTSKLVPFPAPGLIRIYCNIHPEMVSTILVLNNDLFAKTDDDGNFEIHNVPEGEFTLRVWHEFSDEVQRTIFVDSNGENDLSFELMETKKRLQHRNKFGMPYREKY